MKKTVAILAVEGLLISHEFDTEEEALKTMPYITTWSRETWDNRYNCRYHSKSAIKYWNKRQLTDRIHSVKITHKGKNKIYEYS